MDNVRISPLQSHANEILYTRLGDRLVPAHYGDPASEYAALGQSAALVDLSHRTILRLSGRDPLGLLGAVLTNDVPENRGVGVYGALLNPKGRIQTDLRVLKSGGDLLVDTEPEGARAAREMLGRYAPFSRVGVEDLCGGEEPWGMLGLYGPRAQELLSAPDLAEHATTEIEAGGAELLAAGVAVPVPGYDLLGPAAALRALRDRLVRQGAILAGLQAYETARVEAGVPRFGPDITAENFPAEAGILERAVSFEKGCFPGQETVARMRYRGHPNRTLHRLVAQGAALAAGTPILQNGKQVGRLTSVAPLAMSGKRFALGYLSRNADLEGPLSAGDVPVSPVGDQKTSGE